LKHGVHAIIPRITATLSAQRTAKKTKATLPGTSPIVTFSTHGVLKVGHVGL